MHDLGKALVWVVLLAILATAGFNGAKLTSALWQAWQLDSDQRDEIGHPEVGSSSIAFNH